ncbi:MAG: HU family DNA-binding protein [Patescibacteria group bacterium]
MNKTQLAQALSEKVGGVSKAQAEKVLDEMTKLITENLIKGEEVVLAGFGAFSSRKRKGRIGVNPRNVKEQIEIPSVLVAKFKAGKNLKDALKKSGTGGSAVAVETENA